MKVITRLRYFLKLLLRSLFVLFLLNLLTFSLMTYLFNQKPQKFEAHQSFKAVFQTDLPAFFLHLNTQAEPDTLYRIHPKSHRNNLTAMTRKNGNWEKVSDYYVELSTLNNQITSKIAQQQQLEKVTTLEEMQQMLSTVFKVTHDKAIHVKLDSLANLGRTLGEDEIRQQIQQVESAYLSMLSNPMSYKSFIPNFAWYGAENQYVKWLQLFNWRVHFALDLWPENSTYYLNRFRYSFLVIGFSMLCSILLSFLVVYVLTKGRTFWPKTLHLLTLYLAATPKFVLGLLLLFLFSNYGLLPFFLHQGLFTPLFYDLESQSVDNLGGASTLVLPVLTYTLASTAFMSRSLANEVEALPAGPYPKTFVKALKTGGNNLLMLLLFNISSSLMVEYLFGLPGIGRTIVAAIEASAHVVLLNLMLFLATVSVFIKLFVQIGGIDRTSSKS